MREIFQDYEVTPIPCVPDYICGVVNVRGEILSVTDPAKLMGLGAIGADSSVVLPAVVVDKGDVSTALLVDEIGDIIEVTKRLHRAAGEHHRSRAGRVRGRIGVRG